MTRFWNNNIEQMGNIYHIFGKVLLNYKWSLTCYTRQWARSWSWKHGQHLLVLPSVHSPWHCLFRDQYSNAEKSWCLTFSLQLVSWMVTTSLPNLCQIFNKNFINKNFVKFLTNLWQIFNKKFNSTTDAIVYSTNTNLATLAEWSTLGKLDWMRGCNSFSKCSGSFTTIMSQCEKISSMVGSQYSCILSLLWTFKVEFV